jgi:hypothetical protein
MLQALRNPPAWRPPVRRHGPQLVQPCSWHPEFIMHGKQSRSRGEYADPSRSIQYWSRPLGSLMVGNPTRSSTSPASGPRQSDGRLRSRLAYRSSPWGTSSTSSMMMNLFRCASSLSNWPVAISSSSSDSPANGVPARRSGPPQRSLALRCAAVRRLFLAAAPHCQVALDDGPAR